MWFLGDIHEAGTGIENPEMKEAAQGTGQGLEDEEEVIIVEVEVVAEPEIEMDKEATPEPIAIAAEEEKEEADTEPEKQPGFEALFAATGLLAAALFLRLRTLNRIALKKCPEKSSDQGEGPSPARHFRYSHRPFFCPAAEMAGFLSLYLLAVSSVTLLRGQEKLTHLGQKWRVRMRKNWRAASAVARLTVDIPRRAYPAPTTKRCHVP